MNELNLVIQGNLPRQSTALQIYTTEFRECRYILLKRWVLTLI
jgi:hypothetical protein